MVQASSGSNLPVVTDPAQLTAADHLSDEERKQAEQIAATFDASDQLAVISFAAKPQREMTALVEPMLQKVTTRDAGPAGEALTALMSNVRELDASSFAGQLEHGVTRIPLIGRWVNSVERFISRYEKIGRKIDRIVIQLDGSKNTLQSDIVFMGGLFDQNVKYYHELLVYIAAGELKLKDLRAQLDKRREDAVASKDPQKAQAVQDLASVIDRLERRIYDLKLTAVVALQMGPQLRLVQNGDQSLVEKIQSSLLTTIPLWKIQIALAIGLVNQKKGLELQRAVTDTTNRLLTENSAMLRQGTNAVATESQRGVVELETLKKVNDDLIATIDDSIRIQQEGHQRRQEAEQQLVSLQGELRTKLAEVSTAATASGTPAPVD